MGLPRALTISSRLEITEDIKDRIEDCEHGWALETLHLPLCPHHLLGNYRRYSDCLTTGYCTEEVQSQLFAPLDSSSIQAGSSSSTFHDGNEKSNLQFTGPQ